MVEGCRAVAPPGSNPATYVYDASVGTLTVSGEGAHIGLAKAVNAGELSADPAPEVPASITYEVSELTDSSMTVDINYSNGYWRFKMVTADSVAAPAPTFGCNDENATNYDASADVDDGSCLYEVAASVAGDWVLAPTAGALGVGPSKGNIGWWANSEEDVSTRYCLFDDVFSFGEDGTFTTTLDNLTWLEGWQGVDAEGCGEPVAPHDGQTSATYTFANNDLTVSGIGIHGSTG